MVYILSLALLFVAITFTTAYDWSGLDICSPYICHVAADRPSYINITLGFNAVNVACSNLVGDGSFSYVRDERRDVCYQAGSGTNPYRFIFDVHRNKCPDAAMTLDFHSCRDIMVENLNNTIWCDAGPNGQPKNTGTRQQIGCFDVLASAQPGWCAGKVPYVV